MMGLPVVEQNLHFLRQGAELLRRLDDDTFSRPASSRPRSAGVGPHLRHCLDFYRCFFRDLDSGRIDYDHREREPRLESECAAALTAIEEIMRRLAALDEREAEREIRVRCDAAPFEAPENAWHRSTVDRELRFLASHTVHHYALIAQLVRARGIEPGESFGVAPATLAFWETQTAH